MDIRLSENGSPMPEAFLFESGTVGGQAAVRVVPSILWVLQRIHIEYDLIGFIPLD